MAAVGDGVAGTGAALAVSERGESVGPFERCPRARGAGVGNFGVIRPVGRPAGELRRLALRGREL